MFDLRYCMHEHIFHPHDCVIRLLMYLESRSYQDKTPNYRFQSRRSVVLLHWLPAGLLPATYKLFLKNGTGICQLLLWIKRLHFMLSLLNPTCLV